MVEYPAKCLVIVYMSFSANDFIADNRVVTCRYFYTYPHLHKVTAVASPYKQVTKYLFSGSQLLAVVTSQRRQVKMNAHKVYCLHFKFKTPCKHIRSFLAYTRFLLDLHRPDLNHIQRAEAEEKLIRTALQRIIEKIEGVEWTNELDLEFLNIYEKHPALWDPKNRNHKNRNYISDRWTDIKNELSVDFSIDSLKKKKETAKIMVVKLENQCRAHHVHPLAINAQDSESECVRDTE